VHGCRGRGTGSESQTDSGYMRFTNKRHSNLFLHHNLSLQTKLDTKLGLQEKFVTHNSLVFDSEKSPN
jgi:hypothetical protein